MVNSQEEKLLRGVVIKACTPYQGKPFGNHEFILTTREVAKAINYLISTEQLILEKKIEYCEFVCKMIEVGVWGFSLNDQRFVSSMMGEKNSESDLVD